MLTTILIWTGAIAWILGVAIALAMFIYFMAWFTDEHCDFHWGQNRFDDTLIFRCTVLGVGFVLVQRGSRVEDKARTGIYPFKGITPRRVSKKYSMLPMYPGQKMSQEEREEFYKENQ